MDDRMSGPMPPKSREWIPPMLRKSRALALCLFCAMFAAILEVMSILVKNNQGISTRDIHLVYVIRYLPTVGTIVLGFIWKVVIGDVKMILPWSLMSTDWANAADSIALNYINSMEIVSVFTASKRRHWTMVLVLTIGFLTGASVAVANVLTYTEPYAESRTNKDFVKTSTFNLNNAFVFSNGTITLPFGHFGAKPYAAVAAQRQPGGKFAPWTMSNHCFESFGLQSGKTTDGLIIEATVSSISVKFQCENLKYSVSFPHDEKSTIAFLDNTTDLSSIDCHNPVSQTIDSLYHGRQTMGWTNITDCNGKKRILATITSFDLKATGLICSTIYTMQNSSVRAYGSSGNIVNHTTVSEPAPIDLSLPPEAAWFYINNPSDGEFQAMVTQRDTRVIVDNVLEMAQGWTWLFTDDPFFTTLTNGQLNETVGVYLDNTDQFRIDVERLASETLTQVISTLGRRDESQQVPGSITIKGSRLFVQSAALRALQVLLLIICIASLSVSSFLRPSSTLREDPTSTAAVAIILAASDIFTEAILARHCSSSDDGMRRALSQKQCKLSPHQRTHIEMKAASSEVSDPTKTPDQLLEYQEDLEGTGWHPLSLKSWAKCITGFLLCAFIAALAILQTLSAQRSGLCASGQTAQAILGYVTAVILVTLSYICSGIDASVKSLSAYNTLRSSSKRRPLLLRSKEWPTFWIPFKATGKRSGLAVIASSCTLLLFPLIKVIAAGLFADVQFTITEKTVNVDMDMSLMDNIEKIGFNSDLHLHTVRQRASQFTEWSVIPSYNIQQRDGVLDNLVISPLIGVHNQPRSGPHLGYEIRIQSPAIAVDVNCTSISESEFDVKANLNNDSATYLLEFGCKSAKCREVLHVPDRELTALVSAGEYVNMSSTPWDIGTPKPFTGSFFRTSNSWSTVILANSTAYSQHMSTLMANDTRTNATAESLTSFLPTLRMVSCESTLSLVEIETSFKYSDSSADTVVWTPSRLHHESLTYIRQYNMSHNGLSFMPWGDPLGAVMEYDQTLPDEPNIGGQLNDTTLWPAIGGSSNPFQLLAAFAEYKHHNLTSLLDPAQLEVINKEMYTEYATQMLTEMRPFASYLTNSSSPSKKNIQGIMLEKHTRIAQDLHTTIILEGLLVLVFVCVLWVFWRFKSDTILPKEPDSIAARLSLLAGSELVQRLRREGVERVGNTEVWKEQAALGWWRVPGSSGAAEGSRRWRWGIDVGSNVHISGWNQPPEDTGELDDALAEGGHSPNSSEEGFQSMSTEHGDSAHESQSLPPAGDNVIVDGQDSDVRRTDHGILLRRMTL